MSPLYHVKSQIKALYARITLNRITTAFFLSSLIYCFAQGVMRSFLFSLDANYTSLLGGITGAAGIPVGNMTFLQGGLGHLHLRMCNDIPHGQTPYPCSDIFKSSSTVSLNATFPDSSLRQTIVRDNLHSGFSVAVVPDPTNSMTIQGIQLIGGDGTSVILNLQCTDILLFPQQILGYVRREDLTFIFLQIWLLIVSVFAIANDSVPHILTVMATRLLLSGWSIYAVWRTGLYNGRFQELVNSPNSPCGVNFFPTYFQIRKGIEIPDLLLNLTALFLSCYLSWRLLRVYSAQSFKCIGAPKHIVRINRFFLAVLACLQLEAFVLVAAMCLWLDILLHTALEKISEHTPAYKALFILTTLFLIPWIMAGWYGIRREMENLMIAFFVMAFLLIFGWSIMFYSLIYRWTFMEWPFLGCFTVASFILMSASVILAVICRLNFGNGLAEYIEAEDNLASSNFSPEVFPHDEETSSPSFDEKIGSDLPLPTYLEVPTLRFGSGSEFIASMHDPSTYPSRPRDFEPVRGPPLTSTFRGPFPL
ncbi:hypothetical protein BDN72DRAFT_896988 [Pluteus cervinus]|uniref:Uncharacterized protein n=1 Tax=Pluteus cervinus TaxID=181527 RepID=A0ACD3AVP4_9AGAR|nr:hypothetical protein BDN72DRAFT_896988 [Pluteus cervinus]